MYKSNLSSVNYPGSQYRGLSNYYGVLPGMVGTVTNNTGETLSIPVPAFSPPMSQQTVPQYNVAYLGAQNELMHGLRADQLGSGYFNVHSAYPDSCTTFRMRSCDGTVPQDTIPLNFRVGAPAHAAAPAHVAPAHVAAHVVAPTVAPAAAPGDHN